MYDMYVCSSMCIQLCVSEDACMHVCMCACSAASDQEFQGIGRTVIHILEYHSVESLSLHQAGCRQMGEQGAESIYAKFNTKMYVFFS